MKSAQKGSFSNLVFNHPANSAHCCFCLPLEMTVFKSKAA